MTDRPTFLQRKLASMPAPGAPGNKFDPRVNEFLADFAATGEAVQQQRREIERQEVEIEKLHARAGYADTELKRVARARDQFQAQYCELKIALEVIVTSAVSSCEQAQAAINAAKSACILAAENACRVAEDGCQSVIDQARATLASVKAELVRAGIEAPGEIQALTPEEEESARQFGMRYSPRSDQDAAS
jgi:multidrug resistance efflux pump